MYFFPAGEVKSKPTLPDHTPLASETKVPDLISGVVKSPPDKVNLTFIEFLASAGLAVIPWNFNFKFILVLPVTTIVGVGVNVGPPGVIVGVGVPVIDPTPTTLN